MIFELMERYGFVGSMILMTIAAGVCYVRKLLEWHRIRRTTMTSRQYIWATRPKPKQKRKRTLNAPETRYYEALRAIADIERRPHILHEGETFADIAQMRDLAHQQYLRACAERNARETASYPRLIIEYNDNDYNDVVARRDRFYNDLRKEIGE